MADTLPTNDRFGTSTEACPLDEDRASRVTLSAMTTLAPGVDTNSRDHRTTCRSKERNDGRPSVQLLRQRLQKEALEVRGGGREMAGQVRLSFPAQEAGPRIISSTPRVSTSAMRAAKSPSTVALPSPLTIHVRCRLRSSPPIPPRPLGWAAATVVDIRVRTKKRLGDERGKEPLVSMGGAPVIFL